MRITPRRFLNWATVAVLGLVVATSLSGYAADLVYVDKPGQEFSSQLQTKAAADFYGLQENTILLVGKGEQSATVKAIRDPKTVAVVLTISALPSLDQKQILSALKRKNAANIPLLIAGIDEHTDAELLRNWSAGTITESKSFRIEKGTGSYRLASANGITNELAGNTLPMSPGDVRYLTLHGPGAEQIMAAATGTSEWPVFVHVRTGSQEIFFATANTPVDVPGGPSPYREPLVFTNLAPQMMFLRYAAGERAWHSPGRYANLTIDDAWLREPYGFVNYEGLLREMERHNFHTTIAFVPWNFDRSQPAMVSLLRAHADKFSLCIHGNNHDHQEFGPYDTKPLSGQTEDIEQGLARMAKFQELTQLPYDPVMVFPHSMSPEPTLALLKRYNFWATANSLNVPTGAEAPPDAEFALRTATMKFSNFPSLRRYSAEAPGPESQLVVDAFLGNPMLFYVHQAFFAPGIEAFDKTADTVNRLQPDTQWRSLGDITKHLYLLKLRDDGNYDVRTYSGTIRIDNDLRRDAVFFVEKDEGFELPLTVLVDGQPYSYQRSGTRLLTQLLIPKGSSREITIRYRNDLNIAGIDISKRSLRIQGIRRLSDFRDDVVSRTALGRAFIRAYTENEAAWNRMLIILAALLVAVTSAWSVRRAKRHAMMAQDSSVPVVVTTRNRSGD